MKMFRSFFAPLAALMLATPAIADIVPLSAISAYFNAMTTAEASFTQFNDDGSQINGQMFIRRPGRIRFEYSPPDDSLVLANGGQVVIFDSKSNQPPEQFPLNRTPLKLILARNVDLDTANMVVGHTENGDFTSVFAQDPKNPEYGSIELVFSDDPVTLRQWIVTDGSGQRTRVELDEFELGRSYPSRLFSIRRETASRGF